MTEYLKQILKTLSITGRSSNSSRQSVYEDP